jgi:hypothetical protein
MKLDWDLIREQLVCIEEDRSVFADLPKEPEWTDQTEDVYVQELQFFRNAEQRLFGHLELLLENGFMNGITVQRDMDGSFHYGIHSPRLTLCGHELLADLRSKDLWERVKSIAKSKGIELTFDAIKTLSKVALGQIIS